MISGNTSISSGTSPRRPDVVISTTAHVFTSPLLLIIGDVMFEVLQQTETDHRSFYKATESHLKTLYKIKDSFSGVPGEEFVNRYIDAFSKTASPFVVNLDLNCSEYAGDFDRMLEKSRDITEHMKRTVKATAKQVSGYKMNEQSMLTFLIAQEPRFVEHAKELYYDEVGVEPVLWTDEKLRDIPSTTYQTARIIYGLGYDAIHCMPQIGQDVAGALQKAAGEMGNRGTVHVINLTHPGYESVKEDYHKDPVGTINLMRKRALGSTTDVEIGKDTHQVNVRSTGTIEPANRPDEIYQGRRDMYNDDIMIISIGIGPQGALPGCALYSGASIEGIGRFIFQEEEGFSTPEKMERKSRASKRSCLHALNARYSDTLQPYPLDRVMEELKDFNPSIRDVTREGLDRVYKMRLGEHESG